MADRIARLLVLLVVSCGLFLFAGCGERSAGTVDISTIVDSTPVAPETPIILHVNSKGQVKLHDRWFDLYTDGSQIDEYLQRKSLQYRQMYKDYGIKMEKKMVRGECVLVFPVEVIIEPEMRTKMGYISRLTRLCNDNGFQKVLVKREGMDEPTRMTG